jgi:hypothetical protein
LAFFGTSQMQPITFFPNIQAWTLAMKIFYTISKKINSSKLSKSPAYTTDIGYTKWAWACPFFIN